MTPKTHSLVWLVVAVMVAALGAADRKPESPVPLHLWQTESLVPDLHTALPKVVSINGVLLGDNFWELERRFGKPSSVIGKGLECVLYDELQFALPSGPLTVRGLSDQVYYVTGPCLGINGRLLAAPGTERAEIVGVLGEPDFDWVGETESICYYWELGLGIRFQGSHFLSAWHCDRAYHGDYVECCPREDRFPDPENCCIVER